MTRVTARLALTLMLLSFSCVLPYDKPLLGKQDVFIVEGMLTNIPSENFLRISIGIPNSAQSTTFDPVTEAKPVILVNNQDQIVLTEQREGYYLYPPGFKAEPGKTYQLQFTTKDGDKFQSSIETLPPFTKIDSIYHQFDKEAIEHFGEFSAGYNFWINTKDKPDTENFYSWDWRLYESQVWCKQCPKITLFYKGQEPDDPGECVVISDIYSPAYDYQCDRPCWDIYPSRKINIIDDELTNGGIIEKRPLAQIPFYQRRPALLDILQYGISEDYYFYLGLVQNQGQHTGGLADTPPITLQGNVKNLNDPNHAIGGYFVVASLEKQPYWLDKQDAPLDIFPIGLYNGRTPRPEPPSFGESRPPLAPCLESFTRTAIKPEGWQLP